jgi:hypothetical protein
MRAIGVLPVELLVLSPTVVGSTRRSRNKLWREDKPSFIAESHQKPPRRWRPATHSVGKLAAESRMVIESFCWAAYLPTSILKFLIA